MAVTRKTVVVSSNKSVMAKLYHVWNKYIKAGYKELYKIITEPSRCYIVAIILLFVEILVNVTVIEKVPYTEIDWKAYMQEVEGVIVNGTTDYSLLKGDTGPLVYPAGFIWFFAGLYKLTNSGTNIKLGMKNGKTPCSAKILLYYYCYLIPIIIA